MYCSGCGSQIQIGLNYCSRCGRRSPEPANSTSELNGSTLAAITAGVGFIVYVILVRLVTKNDFPTNFLVPVSFIYFASLVSICFMILRQERLKFGGHAAPVQSGEDERSAYLGPATTAQLPEPDEMPISVTEHTTRTLDKVKVR